MAKMSALAARIALGEEHAPKIRRSEVLHNSEHDHPANTRRYSMDTWCEHDYRDDCSGKVSEWFRIPLDTWGSWHGLSTVSMLTTGPVSGSVWFREIPAKDLKPGDVVGIMGLGTDGANGHVRLFLGWAVPNAPNDHSYRCREQAIGTHGPDVAVHDDLAAVGHGPYRAYRYVGIVDDPADPPAVNLPTGILRRGSTGPAVREVQLALIALGYDLGPWGPTGKGDDGIYGQRTEASVRGFQAAAIADGHNLGPTGADGIYGPYTRAALAAELVR